MIRPCMGLVAVMALIAGIIPVPVLAGFFSRSVTIRVQVVDAQNRPVPYATVWMGRFDEEPSPRGVHASPGGARRSAV